ncbi:MAG TPA: PKD domain-containing protein, partial [Luteibaculaceae bacterium]|nr:PKD domain-containing protein [Luteibaculaceae bacterium]
GNNTVCEGSGSTLVFTLEGSGTFNITYTDGTNNYNFSATAANSPVIRSVPANNLQVGVNTFTISNVTNSNPSSVCNIVFSGTGVITQRPTPVVAFSFNENPTCVGTPNQLNFTFPSAGPFDVALVTDSNSTTTVDTLRGISNGFFRSFVSNSQVRFTATQVRFSSGPSCTNNTNQSILLTVRNKPTGSISGTTTVCAGTSAPLRFVFNGTLPITASYSNGVSTFNFTLRNSLDTTIQVTPASSTTYTLTSIADGNSPSCTGTGTGSAVVTVRPLPNAVVSLDASSICESQSARLKFTCSGVAPFTINYTENGVPRVFTATVVGESELTVAPSVTTVYQLVSISSGGTPACSQTLNGSATLTVIPRPNVVLSTTNPQICEGQSARIRANVSGQGLVQIRITNNALTYDTTFSVPAGIHFFNVTPAVGNNIYTAVLVSDQSALSCTRTNASSVSVNVFQKPTGTISTTSEVCEGSSVLLEFNIVGSGLMTVNYANDRGFADAFTTTGGTTNILVNPAPETGAIKYFITGIQSQNGVLCTGVSTDTAIAVVNPAPTVFITSNQKTICRGDSTQLIISASGNGPFEVDFTDGNTNFTVTLVGDNNGDGLFDRMVWVKPSQTTTFRVFQVRDNSAPTCVSNSVVAYTINVNQKPTATISGSTAICAGDSVSLFFALTGRAPLTLVYSGDGGTFTRSGLNPGLFRIDTVKPSASTNYTVLSISDSNSPVCTTAPGQGVATIQVNPIPVATIGLSATTKCANDSVNLIFTVGNGQAPYRVIYSAGGLNDTLLINSSPFIKRVGPTQTTVYQLLSVRDGSTTQCERFFTGDAVTLTVNPLPTVTFSSNVSAVCDGDPVQLTFEGVGGNDLTVNFALNGVAQPPVSLNTDTDNDGNVDATVSSVPVKPSMGDSAVYTITGVTNNTTVCTNPATSSLGIYVNSLPTATLLNATPSVLCEGDTTTLRFGVTGVGNVKVIFRHLVGATEVKRDSVEGLASAGTLSFKVVPFTSTTYEIVSVVSTFNGLSCTGSVVGSGLVAVNVNPRPTVNLSVTTNPICVNGSTSVVVNVPTGTSPYSYEYVVLTKGQQPDTNSVFGQVSGSQINLFNLTDTTVVYIYRFSDSAVPSCSLNDSIGVRINVNPNSTARIYGDSSYCVGQQAGFFLDLVGIGNITVSYRDNFGNIYPSITRVAGTHFIPVNQPIGTRTYTLISVNDQSIPACNGAVSGLARVRVVNTPSAIFSGVSGICEGDVSTFTVQLVGSASDSITVFYHDNFGNNYSYSNRPGIYDVLHQPLDSSIYTPDSVKYKFIACGGNVSGRGQIDVRPTPEGSIEIDTDICNGQSVTATFRLAFDGPFDITYQIGSNPAVNVNQVTDPFSVTFTPNGTTTVRLSQVVYSDIPLCTAINLDQVTVNVYDSLAVAVAPKVCNDINTGYTLQLNISGGKPATYAVNGAPTATPFQSGFIPNGPYSFTVSDSSGCPSVVINNADTCDCASFSGTMAVLTTLEFCDDQVASSVHNGDEVRDANDTLIFVITDRNDGIIGNVFATNFLPSFTYNSSMAFETTYYIVPVVSDTTTDPGFNTADRCISVGQGTPIIWHQNSRVNVEILKNDSGFNCVGDMMTLRFVFTGNGGLGPYNLVFNPGFGGDITRTVNGPVYVETVGPIPASGSVKIKQFNDLSITTGCSRVVDFDSAYPYIGRPLPVANYTISDNQICQGQSVTFTPSIPDPSNRYSWVFGDNGVSQAVSPIHVYNISGTFNSSLTVVNTFGCRATSSSAPIEVQPTPDALFSVSPGTGPYCAGNSINEEITFTDITNYPQGGTVRWFINGVAQPETGGPGTRMIRRFNTPGTYVIRMDYTSPFGCIDSNVTSINIEGPRANPFISAVAPCVDEDFIFQLNNVRDVESFTWNFSGIGLNENVVNANPFTYRFPRNSPNGNAILATLSMTSASGCRFDTTITITVYQSTASAIVTPPAHCEGVSFALTDNSTPVGGPNSIISWNWSFGANSGLPNVTGQNPGSFTYPQDGSYQVVLSVLGNQGCRHSDTVDVTVLPNPDVFLPADTVCDDMLLKTKTARVLNSPLGSTYNFNWNVLPLDPGLSINFIQSGADTSLASFNINGTGLFNVNVEVTNNNTGCKTLASSTFRQFVLADPSAILPTGVDTAYAIGYNLDFTQTPQYNFDIGNPAHSYSWSPFNDISCLTCPNPVINTFEDRTYFLTITDIYGCYPITIPVNIDILEIESIDVPDAFTPNGDNINDKIFPDGLALEFVEEFVVFNRFGDIVHQASGTKDQVAWDGKIKGKLQQNDVYSYRVVLKTFTGKTLAKTGKFTLIR